MLPFVIVTSALASEPNALTQLVSSRPEPVLALRCERLEPLAASLAQLSTMLPGGNPALRGLDAAALEQAGFDLSRPLTMLGWDGDGEDPLLLRMAFKGDTEALESWLTRIAPAHERLGEGRWRLGAKGMELVAGKGELTLQLGAPPEGPAWNPPPGLIDDLPDEGCAVLLSPPASSKLAHVIDAIAVHAGLAENDDAFVRLLLAQELPAAFVPEWQVRPALGRSKDKPTSVVALGVEPIALLHAVVSRPKASFKVKELEEPVNLLSEALAKAGVELTPGLSAAVWRPEGILKGPRAWRYTVIVPMRRAGGGHIPGGRLEEGVVGALETSGVPVSEVDGVHQVQLGKITLSFAARRDRLYVASDPDTLQQSMACLRGRRWADREFRSLARDRTLVVQSDIQQGAGSTGGRVDLLAEGHSVELTMSTWGNLGASAAPLTTMALAGLGRQLDDLFKYVGEEVEKEGAPMEPLPQD